MKEEDDFMAELERLDRFLSGEEAGERPIDVLRAGGLDVPADDELDDQQLHSKLWEIIGQMANLGFFLESTDHCRVSPAAPLLRVRMPIRSRAKRIRTR